MPVPSVINFAQVLSNDFSRQNCCRVPKVWLATDYVTDLTDGFAFLRVGNRPSSREQALWPVLRGMRD